MLYYSGIIPRKWDRYIQKWVFDWRHRPLVAMVEMVPNQICKLVTICLWGMQRSRVWGRRGGEKKKQPPNHKQKSCLCSDWVGCTYNVCNICCDRNSLVVQSPVPLAMFGVFFVVFLFAAGLQIPSFSSVLMYIHSLILLYYIFILNSLAVIERSAGLCDNWKPFNKYLI